MSTLEELQAGLSAVTNEVTELKTSVDAEVAQTAVVIEAVNKLIAAINASGSQDFTNEVAALSAALTGLQEARTKLASDNDSVQAAIDAAGTAIPPAE